MSKTTNYILELESSGEVYFKEDEKQYVTTDRRRHPNANKIYGQGEATRDSLGEAGRLVTDRRRIIQSFSRWRRQLRTITP